VTFQDFIYRPTVGLCSRNDRRLPWVKKAGIEVETSPNDWWTMDSAPRFIPGSRNVDDRNLLRATEEESIALWNTYWNQKFESVKSRKAKSAKKITYWKMRLTRCCNHCRSWIHPIAGRRLPIRCHLWKNEILAICKCVINADGDRNLVCSCLPIEEYSKEKPRYNVN